MCQKMNGTTTPDAVAEGNLGLVEAATRFDPARGVSFFTYAWYWVRHHLIEHNFVERGGQVHVGKNRASRRVYFNLGKAKRATGSDDPDTLAAHLGVDRESLERVAGRLADRDVQLDAQLPGGQEVSALYASPGPSPEEALAELEERARWAERIRRGLRVLDPREQKIVRARHLRRDPLTLGQLGEKLGLSRERVRQLEARALDKLRAALGEAA